MATLAYLQTHYSSALHFQHSLTNTPPASPRYHRGRRLRSFRYPPLIQNDSGSTQVPLLLLLRLFHCGLRLSLPVPPPAFSTPQRYRTIHSLNLRELSLQAQDLLQDVFLSLLWSRLQKLTLAFHGCHEHALHGLHVDGVSPCSSSNPLNNIRGAAWPRKSHFSAPPLLVALAAMTNFVSLAAALFLEREAPGS